MKVALYAAETADPVLSVQNHMNKHLLKYNDKLEGVPICYRDINFEADKAYGHFFYEQPLVHVDVTGKVLIFKPTPGTIVTGKIIKVESLHGLISPLVLRLIIAPTFFFLRFDLAGVGDQRGHSRVGPIQRVLITNGHAESFLPVFVLRSYLVRLSSIVFHLY